MLNYIVFIILLIWGNMMNHFVDKEIADFYFLISKIFNKWRYINTKIFKFWIYLIFIILVLTGLGARYANATTHLGLPIEKSATANKPICTLKAEPQFIKVGEAVHLTAHCSPAANSYAWINVNLGREQAEGNVSPLVTGHYYVVGENVEGFGEPAGITVVVADGIVSPVRASNQLELRTRTKETSLAQVSDSIQTNSLDIRQISAGGSHSIVLKNNGTVWIWGGFIGSNESYKPPAQVQNLPGVLTIAAGNSHSIVVKGDSTVWAWGDNSVGQLGDAGTSNSSVPVQVLSEDRNALGHITSIVAGASHSLALQEDGTVWAWGWNNSGQLGGVSNITSNVAIRVPINGDVSPNIAVAAGGWHSVTLKADGSVWTWGDNSNGQLGDRSTPSNLPAQVNGLSGIVNISAGDYHTVALKQDGTVWTWGSNEHGQLGNGFGSNSSSPVQVIGLNGVRAVTAGSGYTLALRQDGTVYAWGKGDSGQLGNGLEMDSPTPVKVLDQTGAALSDVVELDAGNTHSIAHLRDGTVWAWGSNIYGQILGNSSNTAVIKAMRVGDAGQTPLNLEEHVVFPESRANYILTSRGNVIFVTEKIAAGASYFFKQTKRFEFADSFVAFDIDGVGGQVYRLYQAAFDRKPDQGGLGYWIDAMEKGATLKQVASEFINSAEWKTQYGISPGPDEFLDKLYKNILHRSPDQGGLVYWINAIKSGASYSDILVEFSKSPENQLGVNSSLQNGFEYIPVTFSSKAFKSSSDIQYTNAILVAPEDLLLKLSSVSIDTLIFNRLSTTERSLFVPGKILLFKDRNFVVVSIIEDSNDRFAIIYRDAALEEVYKKLAIHASGILPDSVKLSTVPLSINGPGFLNAPLKSKSTRVIGAKVPLRDLKLDGCATESPPPTGMKYALNVACKFKVVEGSLFPDSYGGKATVLIEVSGQFALSEIEIQELVFDLIDPNKHDCWAAQNLNLSCISFADDHLRAGVKFRYTNGLTFNVRGEVSNGLSIPIATLGLPKIRGAELAIAIFGVVNVNGGIDLKIGLKFDGEVAAAIKGTTPSAAISLNGGFDIETVFGGELAVGPQLFMGAEIDGGFHLVPLDLFAGLKLVGEANFKGTYIKAAGGIKLIGGCANLQLYSTAKMTYRLPYPINEGTYGEVNDYLGEVAHYDYGTDVPACSTNTDMAPTVSIALNAKTVEANNYVSFEADAKDDFEIASYAWSQLSGPKLDIQLSSEKKILVFVGNNITNPAQPIVLQVTVKDNKGQSAVARASLVVIPGRVTIPDNPIIQPRLTDFSPKVMNFGEATELVFEGTNFPRTAVVDLQGHFCDNNHRVISNTMIRVTCTAANGQEGSTQIRIKATSGQNEPIFAEKTVTLRYAPATLKTVSPMIMTQFESIKISVTGQRLDARLFVNFKDAICGTPTIINSTTMEVICQPQLIGTKEFVVLGATGGELLRMRIIVTGSNTPPTVMGLTATSPIKMNADLIGFFEIRDAEGDQVKNLRVHASRTFDGSDCQMDIGNYYSLQDIGIKNFSGCASLASSIGFVYLKVEARDSKDAQATVQRTIVTVALGVGIAPSTPNGASPGTDPGPGPTLGGTGVNLTWGAVGGATSYDVGLRDLTANILTSYTANGNSAGVSGLIAGHAYRWNVAACNSAGCSSYTTALYFTLANVVTAPSTPNGASPGTDPGPGPTLGGTGVNLTWGAVGGATSYDVGLRDLTANILTSYTANGNSAGVSGLIAGHAYRWNVAACNSAGCSSYTTALYFKIR
jgi:alpha-tubulin suppressor-like RCC1 family protein